MNYGFHVMRQEEHIKYVWVDATYELLNCSQSSTKLKATI